MARTLIYILKLLLLGNICSSLLYAEPSYPVIEMQLRSPDPEPWSNEIQEYTLDILAEALKSQDNGRQIFTNATEEQKLYMLLTLQEIATGQKTRAALEMTKRFSGSKSDFIKEVQNTLTLFSNPTTKAINPFVNLKPDPLKRLTPERAPTTLALPDFHTSFEKSQNSKSKIEHIHATLIHPIKEHLPFLYKIAMNKTESPDVRTEAILAIAKLQGDASIPFLRSILKDKSDWNEVRAAVINSKDWLSNSAFAAEITEITSGPVTEDLLYSSAIWSLAFEPVPKNIKHLSDLSLDPNTPPEVRYSALQGLSRTRPPLGVEVFNHILAHPESYTYETGHLALQGLIEATRTNRRLPGSVDGLKSVLSRVTDADIYHSVPDLWAAIHPQHKSSLSPYDRLKIGEVPSLMPLTYAMQFSRLSGVPLDPEIIENQFLALPDNILKVAQPGEVSSHLFSLGLLASKPSYALSPKMEKRMASLLSDKAFDPKQGLDLPQTLAYESLRAGTQIKGQTPHDEFMGSIYEGLVNQLNTKKSALGAISDLVRTIPNWTANGIMQTPDKYLPSSAQSSWEATLKEMGTLFLLKASSVDPQAKKMTDKMVRGLLKSRTLPANPKVQNTDDTRKELREHLTSLGETELLTQMERSAANEQNRAIDGKYSSSTILYFHQYRNLVLKEILRSYEMSPEEQKWLESKLEENEKELTNMLSSFEKAREFESKDGNAGGSNFNTYAFSTMVLTAKKPGNAEHRLIGLSSADHAPYWPSFDAPPGDARSSAARDIPFRLAVLEHAKSPLDKKLALFKLNTAVDNYMLHLPDLILHSRRDSTHEGPNGLAPYYFHPTIPYLTSSIEILLRSYELPKERLDELRNYKAALEQILLSQQLPDGTFATPDQMGAYVGAKGWVNPLMGLALLPLVEGNKDDGATFGILTPD